MSVMVPLPDLIAALWLRGDDYVEATLPQMSVGRFQCRNVRLFLAAARLDGLEVYAHEERGLIESEFLIRMSGTARLLHRHLSALDAHVQAAQHSRARLVDMRKLREQSCERGAMPR